MSNADDAHGWASAATFMDELVQRCQDGKGQDSKELRFAFIRTRVIYGSEDQGIEKPAD